MLKHLVQKRIISEFAYISNHSSLVHTITFLPIIFRAKYSYSCMMKALIMTQWWHLSHPSYHNPNIDTISYITNATTTLSSDQPKWVIYTQTWNWAESSHKITLPLYNQSLICCLFDKPYCIDIVLQDFCNQSF